MRKRYTWFWRVALLVVAVPAISGAVGLMYLYQTVAPVSGEFYIPGLGGKVTIYFDEYERPYVQAETLADALAAEGWLHASHRLWQMEMFRRAGKGRLSELLGSSMLDSDKELWRTGVPQLARELAANASTEMNNYVAAYVNGVNAAIGAKTSSPPEFILLQHTVTPWSTEDVYAMGALMAFQSANNSGNELLRLALFEELGAERAVIFLPDEASQIDFPYVLRGLDATAIHEVIDDRAALDPVDTELFSSFAFGSNGWVVSPEKSATGHALFAFDSHDAFGLPNLFYEVHLFYGDGHQIRGWSVAGLPGVINGYNERIAWGFTNIGDSQDLFVETRSPDNPLHFKDGGEWYQAETETVEIPVSGRDEAERLEIVYTRNGNLISDEPPIALRWTVQDLDGMGLDSLLDLNTARNWDEFTDALDRFAAPSLNATYADVDGTIGFRTAGRLPVRGRGVGLLPLSGDDPANCWQGFIEASDMPARANPPEGFLAAANARVNAEGDGPLVSADNAPGYRVRRIQSVLSEREGLTVDDMRALQVDWHDTQAELLLPVLLPAIEGAEFDGLAAEACEIVRKWASGPVATRESGAAILFQVWYRALATEVFRPALSDENFTHLMKNNYPLNHALDRLITREPDSEWWRGDRDGIVRTAFRKAAEELRVAQGDDVSHWRLDRMHSVRVDHELGKAVPQLAWLFNAEPAPWGGAPSTVGRARYRYDRAYDATAGATVRVVGEMKASGPEMAAVMPGGQSGHPLSDHYVDQLPAWLDGEVLPVEPPNTSTGITLMLLPQE